MSDGALNANAMLSGKEGSGFRVPELRTKDYVVVSDIFLSVATWPLKRVCIIAAQSLLKLQSLGLKFSICSKETHKAQPVARQTFLHSPANVLLPGSFLMTKVM